MGKCKYWKKCKLYDEVSNVCSKTNGMYYSNSRPGGCYRKMEAKEKKS